MRKILFAVFLIVAFAHVFFGQDKDACASETLVAPYSFTYPAKITDYTGEKIFFSISLSKNVFISEMTVDDKTQFPVGFEKNYKKDLWYIFFCTDKPQTVAWVQQVGINRIKLETRVVQLKRIQSSIKKKE